MYTNKGGHPLTNQQRPEIDIGPVQTDVWLHSVADEEEGVGEGEGGDGELPLHLTHLQTGGKVLKYNLERNPWFNPMYTIGNTVSLSL